MGKELIIAKVTSVEPMKKKKGSVLVGLQTGEDSATAIVTYENLEEDQLVIFAPEGSLVNGKPVKRAKVAGEWNEGVICSASEMGWQGDASKAIVVHPSHEVGAKAPANSAGAGPAGAAGAAPKQPAGKKQESESDESEEEKPQAKGKKPGARGGAGGFAQLQDSDDEDEEDSEDEDDRKQNKASDKKSPEKEKTKEKEKSKKSKD